MSKLEELINTLCPNGVEYKPLGEMVTFNRGTAITQKEIENGEIPVIAGGQKPAYYCNRSNRSGETIVVAGSGAYAGFVSYWDKPIFVSDAFSVDVKNGALITRYLYHFLLNEQNNIYAKKKGSGVPHVYGKELAHIKIPVPPIAIQREIVRILDNFTELTAELTAELSARKKQYNYFCDKLLTQSNHISYKLSKVIDLAKFTYGFTDKAKDVGNVRYIRITDIDETGCLKHDDKKFLNLSENNHSYLLKKGDLVMARTGATFGKTLYFEDNEPAIYASFLIKIELDNNKILNRFYWHFSKSSLYWEQANNLVSTGGQPQFNTGAIGQVVVPIPPLEEQERIVAILDRFDKLCNDISEGLPAEIEARKKQYEYYRNKLLTFKEKMIGG